MASPAKIGPMKRARLKITELIATADPRSARGTSEGTQREPRRLVERHHDALEGGQRDQISRR